VPSQALTPTHSRNQQLRQTYAVVAGHAEAVADNVIASGSQQPLNSGTANLQGLVHRHSARLISLTRPSPLSILERPSGAIVTEVGLCQSLL
jgi:hypothetical protein